MNITPDQLHILRHSLGFDDNGNGREYRNHYACDPEPDLIALCELGYMVSRGSVEMFGGMHCYHVTESGKDLVGSLKPPEVKLSRSKRRYRAFLRSDSSMSFIEWLKVRGSQIQ